MADATDPMSVLNDEFDHALGRARRGSKAWSCAHHGSGTLSILASAVAAYIAASHADHVTAAQSAQIAALSGAAATLTAIRSFAGFSKKWRINRATRLELDLLRLDWEEAGHDKLRDRFCQIMRAHERGILAAEPE